MVEQEQETKEEVVERPFEGIIVHGKKFPFRRLTISETAKILRSFIPGFFKSSFIIIVTLFSPFKEDKRWWKKVRSVAFKKNFTWKYFGVVPKELRCSVMLQKEAEAAEESFFVYAPVIVKELKLRSGYAKHLQIENKNQKLND
jgi:hypothetical protein